MLVLIQTSVKRLVGTVFPAFLPPASGLKRGKTQTVAAIVADLGNPSIAPVLRGIASRLEPAGFMWLFAEAKDDSSCLERILNHLLSRRVDVIILTAGRVGDSRILRRFVGHGIQLVLVLQGVHGIRFPSCTNDDLLGGTLAAQHLLAFGHGCWRSYGVRGTFNPCPSAPRGSARRSRRRQRRRSSSRQPRSLGTRLMDAA